jgi:ParB-like chromosome segregation protein Spo0J
MRTIRFNGIVYTCPFADVMPPLTPQDRSELKADIEANGITYPVIVSDTDEGIDGLNRFEIAVELGLPVVPIKVLEGLSPERKREMAEDLNTHRRHLSREQKQDLIARRLKDDPTRSDNAIAKESGVSDKTVGKMRKKLQTRSEIPNSESRVDTSGRKQRAKKPPRQKAVVKTLEQPVSAPDQTAESHCNQEVLPTQPIMSRERPTESKNRDDNWQSQPVLPFIEPEESSDNQEITPVLPPTEHKTQINPESEENQSGRHRTIGHASEAMNSNLSDARMPEQGPMEINQATMQDPMLGVGDLKMPKTAELKMIVTITESARNILKRLVPLRPHKRKIEELVNVFHFFQDAMKILRM